MPLIDELGALARDNDEAKRRELLRRISEMFVENASSCGNRELALFDEVMSRVVDQVEVSARVELAESLAPHEGAPRGIIMKLASDEAEVAKPVLEHSPVLSNDDLVTIAASKSDAHMQAIARRRSLVEAVTDVLVRRGSKLVLHTVTGNHGARFSSGGFNELARRATDDRTLQMRLAAREDLPPEVVQAIVPVLSDDLRQRLIRQGYDLRGALPDEMIAQLRVKLSSMLENQEREANHLAMIIAQIKAGQMKLADAAIDLAQQDRMADLAELFAAQSSLPAAACLGTLLGDRDEPLFVLLRALELDALVLEAVMRLRAQRKRRPYRNDPEQVARFLAVTPEIAQRALRFHKVRAAVA